MDESRLIGRTEKDIDRLKKNDEKFKNSAEKYLQEAGSEARKVNMTEKRKVTFTSDAKNFMKNDGKNFFKSFLNMFSSKEQDSMEEQTAPNLKAQSPEEKRTKSISHKTIAVCVIFLIMVFMFSFLMGLFKDSSSKADENDKGSTKPANTSTFFKAGAVTGEHLTNVPVDYASLAESEARKNQKERKPRPDEIDTVKAKTSSDKKVDYAPAKAPEPPKDVPNTVTVPHNDARNRLQEAYIRKLEKEQEAKFKALEAPIRFELSK